VSFPRPEKIGEKKASGYSWMLSEDSVHAGSETLLLPAAPVLKDHLVKDLPAMDASPPKEMLRISVKLFVRHGPAASMALHLSLPGLFEMFEV
jgi:hypothetical protein